MPLKTLSIISALLLVGCATHPPEPPPEPVVVTEYIYPDCGRLPARDPVNLRPLSWRVIDGLFTLSPEGYEDLSYNISELTRGVKQLFVQLEYYDQCLTKRPSG